jgi:hypothetical protein
MTTAELATRDYRTAQKLSSIRSDEVIRKRRAPAWLIYQW